VVFSAGVIRAERSPRISHREPGVDAPQTSRSGTREYVIFGGEWWLYVLNRIAEHPERALTALADLNPS
jgi:hypothetical protein